MYCSYCGNQIPNDSSFCQKCGHSLEVPQKKGNAKWIVMICVIAFVGITSIVGLLLYMNGLITEKNELIARNESLNRNYRDEIDQYNQLKADYNTLKRQHDEFVDNSVEWAVKATILDSYVVFVGADERYYHKYGCEYLDMSSFWAFNEDAARSKRYKACPHCID